MKYKPIPKLSVRERLLECANIKGPDECWEWKKPQRRFRLMGRVERAHRASWTLHKGPIPPGLLVCHHCDNPPCINPKHLFLGNTSGKNKLNSGRKKRRPMFNAEQLKEIRAMHVDTASWPRGTYGPIIIESYEEIAETFNTTLSEIIDAIHYQGPYGIGSLRLIPYV